MVALNRSNYQDFLEASPPQYSRSDLSIGVLHLGLGAFHRSHQCVFIDQAIRNGHTDMAIASVSQRKVDVADTMAAQDGLFTLLARDAQLSDARIIGALTEPLFHVRDLPRIIEIVQSPNLKAITLTVTEKAYQIAGEDSIPVRLANLLITRFEAGQSGIAIISCDNMPSNGLLVKRLVLEVLTDKKESEVIEWVEKEVRFPNSMIDRIVPAITKTEIDKYEITSGYRDESLITTEPFSQWVIEHDPIAKYLEPAGVQFVDDVQPYELTKIRLFNGVHSTLAYISELIKNEYIATAIIDPIIAPYIKSMQEDEIVPSILDSAGINLVQYSKSVRDRISNVTLRHRAQQVAMDGSQKLQQRFFDGLNDLAKIGKPAPRLTLSLAMWIHYLATSSRVNDPLAEQLIEIAKGRDELTLVRAMLGLEVFKRPLNPIYFEQIAYHLLNLRNEPTLDVIADIIG
jgi:fructuronate reductase